MTAERVSDETETRPEDEPGAAPPGAALRARYLDLWEANLSAWAAAGPAGGG